VRSKELASQVEGKAAASKQTPHHESAERTQTRIAGYSWRSDAQPGGVPVRPTHGSESHPPHFSQSSHARKHLLQLQRRYGNRYVQRVLNRDGKQKARFESAEDLTEEEVMMPKSVSGPLHPSTHLGQQEGKSGGSRRSASLKARSVFKSPFRADFSRLDNHTRTDPEESNEEPGPEAFPRCFPSYFNKDKYEPQSNSGNLPAHLSSRTQQQKGSTLHLKQQTAQAQGGHLERRTPIIQRAWYNFKIPFTDYEFDPSIEGVKNAASIAKNAVVDSATWVKDIAVEGFEWIFDQIKEMVSSGIDWLNGKFSEIKEFATSSFDTLRNGLSNLLGNITSPVSLITAAFQNMDADLLGSAWNALKSGASAVWEGFKTLVDGVFSIGTGLWNTVSGYVSSLFGSVRSLIDSWPFRQLPEFLQRGARALFGELQALWEKVSNFIYDTLKRLKSFTESVLQSVEDFVKKIVDSGIDKVIATIRAIKDAWIFINKIADDPEAFIRPALEKIAAKLNSEVPPQAIELGQQKLREASGTGQSAVPGARVIQRQPATTKPTRSTASSDEVDRGITDAITTAWANLDIGKMLWESVVNMFWPPATIRAIGREFYELWTNDWANAASNLFAPRNILEDPLGFFHDVWSNILILLDFPLALWRRLNSVFMLLLGYLTVVLVIVGAVGGGIAGAAAGGVGAIPGALAGAMAGLELAGAIGLAALASYLGAESISVIKWIVELRTARQTEDEKTETTRT
jgi:hypothetical protein